MKGARSIAAVGLLAAGCVEAWAQPRPPARDAGARMDAARPAVRRDAGVATRRDAGAAARRDVGEDVPVLPPTHGRIEPREAQRVLATRSDEVRRCYERALAQAGPALVGELTARLRVEADGRVSQTALSGDDALRPAGRCIEEALRGLVFPAPAGGAATVTVPYVFRAGE